MSSSSSGPSWEKREARRGRGGVTGYRPHFDETIELPLPVIEPLARCRVLPQLELPDSRGLCALAPRGHEVAWEQFKLPVGEPESAVELARAAKLTPHENDNELRIVGDKFSVTFDKTTDDDPLHDVWGDGVVPKRSRTNFGVLPPTRTFGNGMPERLGIWREAGRRERLKKCRYVRTRTEIPHRCRGDTSDRWV